MASDDHQEADQRENEGSGGRSGKGIEQSSGAEAHSLAFDNDEAIKAAGLSVTIKQLRAFVAVARTRSFAEASEQVHLSQPALSIAIKNLEEIVGGRLLSRTTRSLSLTPEGEAFLPVAQRLLRDWSGAIGDLHQRFALQRGRLAIAAMPSYAGTELPRVFARFTRRHPSINITLHDVIAEDVLEMVRSGRAEIGLTFDPGSSDDLVFEPLFSDSFVAALPQGHNLLEKPEVSWTELIESPFIALQLPSSVRLLLDRHLAREKLSLPVGLEANQIVTLNRMVAEGLGVSAVPALCKQQMVEMGVEHRPLISPEITRSVGILTRKRHPLSRVGEEMVSVLREYYGVAS
ncbi:MAG: LysR family transcriptional regulator [Cellvibrionaceae bacterium]